MTEYDEHNESAQVCDSKQDVLQSKIIYFILLLIE